MKPTIYEYIIIGAGISGCTIASKLVEIGHKVALFDIKSFNSCKSEKCRFAFNTPEKDLIEWKNMGIDGWEYEDIQFYFNRIRQNLKIERRLNENRYINDIFLGLKRIRLDDNFSKFKVKTGYAILDKIKDQKELPHEYLQSLEKWEYNLKLFGDTRVNKLLINPMNRIVGVETLRGNFYTTGEVIICAGAIETPKLLLLSGIGDKKYLKEMKISPIAHVPGVGINLMLKPEITLKVNLYKDHIFDLLKVNLSKDHVFDIIIFDQIGDVNKKNPNIMINMKMSENETLCISASIMNSKSKGYIKLKSLNSNDPPIINFQTDPDDIKLLMEGIKKYKIPHEGDIKLEDKIKIIQPVGTCKMGSDDDPYAVVNNELKVRNVKGLRIADESIFPTNIGVDPYITIMMIANRCVDFILKDNIDKKRISCKL